MPYTNAKVMVATAIAAGVTPQQFWDVFKDTHAQAEWMKLVVAIGGGDKLEDLAKQFEGLPK